MRANLPSMRSGRQENARPDRKSTRLNSSHTEISPLPLHDALPIFVVSSRGQAGHGAQGVPPVVGEQAAEFLRLAAGREREDAALGFAGLVQQFVDEGELAVDEVGAAGERQAVPAE